MSILSPLPWLEKITLQRLHIPHSHVHILWQWRSFLFPPGWRVDVDFQDFAQVLSAEPVLLAPLLELLAGEAMKLHRVRSPWGDVGTVGIPRPRVALNGRNLLSDPYRLTLLRSLNGLQISVR